MPASFPITLVVSIDTEEEFDWHAPFNPRSIEVTNIARQPRAQAIFDEHGIRPTYLVDYPVAACERSRDILGGIASDGRCEIGAHLHPWVTPPHEGPIDSWSSYAGNLPPALERAKLEVLTETIEAGFHARPTVFRAGRYGVGPSTMSILESLGYRLDSSVVPFFDFSVDGGPDFSAFDDRPFQVSDRLIELPLTVAFSGLLARSGPQLYPMLVTGARRRLRLAGLAARMGLLERLRLTPEGHSLEDMIRHTTTSIEQGARLFMLSYHSSSLLPGGTPYVRDQAECDAFLRTLAGYCSYFMGRIGGRTSTPSEVARALRPGA